MRASAVSARAGTCQVSGRSARISSAHWTIFGSTSAASVHPAGSTSNARRTTAGARSSKNRAIGAHVFARSLGARTRPGRRNEPGRPDRGRAAHLCSPSVLIHVEPERDEATDLPVHVEDRAFERRRRRRRARFAASSARAGAPAHATPSRLPPGCSRARQRSARRAGAPAAANSRKRSRVCPRSQRFDFCRNRTSIPLAAPSNRCVRQRGPSRLRDQTGLDLIARRVGGIAQTSDRLENCKGHLVVRLARSWPRARRALREDLRSIGASPTLYSPGLPESAVPIAYAASRRTLAVHRSPTTHQHASRQRCGGVLAPGPPALQARRSAALRRRRCQRPSRTRGVPWPARRSCELGVAGSERLAISTPFPDPRDGRGCVCRGTVCTTAVTGEHHRVPPQRDLRPLLVFTAREHRMPT